MPQQTLRKLYYRFFRPQSLWHMRHYPKSFGIDSSDPDSPILTIGKEKHHLPCWSALKTSRIDNSLSILASGPSIKSAIHKIQNSDLAFVNGALNLVPEFDGITEKKYFLATDPNFIKMNFSTIKGLFHFLDYILLSPRALYELSIQSIDFLNSYSDKLFLVDQLHEPFGKNKLKHKDLLALTSNNKHVAYDPDRNIGFSADPFVGIFNGGTVVYSMLQISAFLEYQEIKIYGMDFGGNQRFYDEAKKAPSYLDRDFESLICPSMYLAKSFLTARGRKVYNMSPNSRLPRDVFLSPDPSLT